MHTQQTPQTPEPLAPRRQAQILAWPCDVAQADAATVDGWIKTGRAFLVDVREPHEYEAERIPGSFLVPMSRLDAGAFPGVGDLKLVLVSGHGPRAVAVGGRLRQAGAGRVHVLEGGIEAWTAAGFETED